MIQLHPVSRPAQLTDEKVAEWTTKFKADGKSVWGKDYIKKALSEMSSNKCCYCECKLDIEDKYLEVEHFRCKKDFPDLVLEWSNLLPSCKRCNGCKGSHHVDNEPIIHPVEDVPNEHLIIKNYRLKGKTDKGKLTVRLLKLNDSERLEIVRFELGEKLKEYLEDVREWLEDYENGTNNSPARAQKIRRKLVNLMQEATPKWPYSATMATVLLNNADYQKSKQSFQKLNWWSENLQKLEAAATFCALDQN